MPEAFCAVPTPVGKRFSRLDLISHAVTFAFDKDGFRMMQKPVEGCRGKGAIVVEDFRPVFKGAIGSNKQSALLIAEADDLEQEVCSCLVNRQEAKLV